MVYGTAILAASLLAVLPVRTGPAQVAAGAGALAAWLAHRRGAAPVAGALHAAAALLDPAALLAPLVYLADDAARGVRVSLVRALVYVPGLVAGALAARPEPRRLGAAAIALGVAAVLWAARASRPARLGVLGIALFPPYLGTFGASLVAGHLGARAWAAALAWRRRQLGRALAAAATVAVLLGSAALTVRCGYAGRVSQASNSAIERIRGASTSG